jgi:GntR family transcriptional regulator, vanillate catabolism transcriptional regulator
MNPFNETNFSAHDELDSSEEPTVLRRLRDLLLGAEIPPVTKLTAEKLADMLGVSRTPIRNALAVLESEGLVEYSKNRGFTAREFSAQDILDAIETRASLEATAVRILSERGIDKSTLDRLFEYVEKSKFIVSQGIWNNNAELEWYSYNYEFHRLLIKATNNKYLLKAITVTLVLPVQRDSIKIAPFSIRKNLPSSTNNESVPDHIRHSQFQHEKILGLISSRQSVRAYQVMFEHVIMSKDRAIQLLDK